MDKEQIEQIKSMATDVNNVAAAAYQSGVNHTTKRLESITTLCTQSKQDRLSQEELAEEAMSGFGGNSDDAFGAGMSEGKADLASQILNIINAPA